MALLFSLLELLTAGLEQLAVGKKSLVGELGNGPGAGSSPLPCGIVLQCCRTMEI